ncbi:hypothetical protein JXA80_12930 [bacterium]|nr:hypothetical protein [candidate division CSSED10-310 bacterium]
MMEKWFELETQSHVIVSASGVQEGSHVTLDYLPGSVFQGLAASIPGLSPDHLLSGHIRFSDALPVVDNRMTVPVPLSVHKAKFPAQNGPTYFNGLYDLSEWSDCQPTQVRKNYIDPVELQFFSVPCVLNTKTAIERDRYGASKDGSLFSYQSIPPGIRYRFRIELDDSVDHRVVEQIIDCLTGSVRIGRSRNAEFGHVRIEPMDRPEMPVAGPEPMGSHVVFYLQSDLAPVSAGVPVMLPEPALFGLPADARFNRRLSYVRMRSFSPWNRFFGRRMTMRHVWVKGSVIVFDTGRDWSCQDLEALQCRSAPGVGLYTSEGYGAVRVNPVFVIRDRTLKIVEWTGSVDAATKNNPSKSNHLPIDEVTASPLIRLLIKRSNRKKRSMTAAEKGRRWAETWVCLMNVLRQDGEPVPGKTQWSGIRELAVANRDHTDQFLAALALHCLPPPANTPEHHRSVRHRYWNGKVWFNDHRVSLYEQILNDVRKLEPAHDSSPNPHQNETRTPGTGVDAVIHAIRYLSRGISCPKKEKKS